MFGSIKKRWRVIDRLNSVRTVLLFIFLIGSANAVSAADAAPGVNRVDRLVSADLDELLESASAPVFSPDGQHLYFSRLTDPALALVVALAFDSDGQPDLAATVSSSSSDFESVTELTLRAFNATGTRAYATASLDDQFALIVLERDPQSGGLSVVQTVDFAANEQPGSLQISADFQFLYVAVPTQEPIRNSSNTIVGFETTGGQIIRYTLGDDGQLENAQSVVLDAESAAQQLRLLDDDQRLLVSTNTTLTEYGIDPTDTVLTPALQVTDLPLLEPRNPDSDPPGPGPMDLVISSDGSFVIGVLDEGPSVIGGYINSWTRQPATGELRLVDQIAPDGFIENFLYDPFPAVLSADDNLLLLPSFSGRFFAGSASVLGCINAFAIEPDSGELRVAGIDCSQSSGRGLAQRPSTEQFYSIYHGLRQFSNDPPPAGAIGVFEPGRILSPTNIHAAVLPSSRTLANRETNPNPVTYFSSVLNAGNEDAERCTITTPDDQGISLRYQVTDPTTNEPLDPNNFSESFSVPANGAQTLLISLFAFNDFTTRNISLEYQCLNAPTAPKITGVNNLLVSASNESLPDLITATATISNDGITRLASTEGQSAFAVSTINIGGEDEIRAIPTLNFASFVASLDAPDEIADLRLEICETNPSTGACLAPPSEEAVRRIATDEIVTYTVFVTGEGSEVAFAPGVNRAFIVLVDSAGEVRGASSVAVTTQP